jgi:hypothetical protein
MMVQNLGRPNRDNFGTPFWESRDKESLGRGRSGAMQRILYGGRWWLPRAWAVVSQVSPRLSMACPNIKRVHNEF